MTVTELSLRVFEDHCRAYFGDHHGRRVGVAGRDRRHHRGVDDTQAVETEDAQPLVDDGERIAR